MSLQFIPYDPTGTKKAKKNPTVVQPLSMPTVASSLPQTPVLPPATNSTANNLVQSNLGLSPSEPPPTTVAQVSSGMEVPSSEGNPVSGPPVVEDPAPSSEEHIEGDGPPSSAPGGELPSGAAPDDNDDDWVDDDDQSYVPSGKPGISTWCKQNPQRHVIPLRKGRKKQTTETRATAKMKRAVNKEKSKNLQVDINSINAARNKLAEETAAKHGVKVELVLCRFMALSSYQHERKVNLFNAKMHDACKKARQARHSANQLTVGEYNAPPQPVSVRLGTETRTVRGTPAVIRSKNLADAAASGNSNPLHPIFSKSTSSTLPATAPLTNLSHTIPTTTPTSSDQPRTIPEVEEEERIFVDYVGMSHYWRLLRLVDNFR
ncbi:hypothetical protein B0H14DRAFT_2575918 [Mycena olivaceomarginata]|nr:hypothetical protein B0H14DRAFT_2575918 [Mycena olivaceomarginata]